MLRRFRQNSRPWLKQAAANFGNGLSGVVQVVSDIRADNSYQPKFEWANLKYQATQDTSVRIVRVEAIEPQDAGLHVVMVVAFLADPARRHPAYENLPRRRAVADPMEGPPRRVQEDQGLVRRSSVTATLPDRM